VKWSVVNDGLAKIFPELVFEESAPELDHAGDIDYVAKIGNKAKCVYPSALASLSGCCNAK
jgi:hypothetical protein